VASGPHHGTSNTKPRHGMSHTCPVGAHCALVGSRQQVFHWRHGGAKAAIVDWSLGCHFVVVAMLYVSSCLPFCQMLLPLPPSVSTNALVDVLLEGTGDSKIHLMRSRVPFSPFSMLSAHLFHSVCFTIEPRSSSHLCHDHSWWLFGALIGHCFRTAA
jgi:hypothetical protein